jgi:hypothetical protein
LTLKSLKLWDEGIMNNIYNNNNVEAINMLMMKRAHFNHLMNTLRDAISRPLILRLGRTRGNGGLTRCGLIEATRI